MRTASHVLVCLAGLLCAGRAAADEAAPVLSKPPHLVHSVAAEPPPGLAAIGQADVVLGIDVDEHGHVEAVAIATPGPSSDFDEAAIAAAKQFVFTPGEYQGKPVPVRVTYRYHFAMKPAPPVTPPAATPAAAAPGPMVPLDGRVLMKGDRVPVAGVTVVLAEGEQQAITDEQGEFHFAAVAVGVHDLKLRGGGIVPVDGKITLNQGKRLQLTYYVAAKQRYASTVRGKRAVVETVEQTLQSDEIKRIPGTQGDLLKAVQNLPGVARSPFGIGLLVVWGSAPQDTRTYVDGVYIPTLYHFGGLRSTVNSEMVQSLTFSPGAYGVDHGLGLGGVVDVESRKPRSDGFHGFAQIDLIDASAMLEGPITKKLSFAVGARASLIGLVLPLATRGSTLQLTTQYYDYQAKLSYRPTPRDDLDLFIFGSDDAIDLVNANSNPDLSAVFGSHTYYHRGIGSWLHRFRNRATLSLVTSIGYDVPFDFRVSRGASVSSLDPGLLSYTLRAVARIPLASFLRVDAGLDYEGNRFSFDRVVTSGTGGAVGAGGGFGGGGGGGGSTLSALGSGFRAGNLGPDNMVLFTDHPAPYASLTLSLLQQRLTIVPQFRLEIMTFDGYPGTQKAFSSVWVRPEPRLSVRYQALRWMAVKAAVGVFDQPPDQQNLSLVYGNPKLQPEWGVHYVAGFEFQPTATLHIELEGFYKDMRNLVVTGERASDPLYVNDGLGRVYGGELMVRQELWHNLFGWISYTLSRAERKDHPDQDWHIFLFDQTHILTLIASYKLPRGYQVGIRFRYVTGNPYTPVLSAFYNANASRYIPIYGPMYSSRLPSFNQLDVRFDKTWTFNRWRLAVYLDLQNLYDAANPEGITYNYNFRIQNPINGLPLLPVAGIRGEF